ncbi:MAG: YbaK/EbsC family protein [Microthrixaceae bacterium]|nr:YbaK/EbsC family protein [Microthrixaceae bacterium]
MDTDPTDEAVVAEPTARVLQALHEAGIKTEARVLPESTRTASHAAKALDCEIGAIANSLLFVGDGEPILILTSGSHRVNVERLAGRLGLENLRMATPEEAFSATGQRIGGVSPLGHPSPVRTFIDVSLRAYPMIWAAAGTANSVFNTTFDDLRRATNAVDVEVG